jgi:HK97 family phage major capsid protein
MSKKLKDRIEELSAERDQARDEALGLAAGDDFDETDEDFVALETRALGLDKQITKLTDLMAAQDAADVLDAKLSKTQHRAEKINEKFDPGQLFVDSDQFRSYNGHGRSSVVDLGVQHRALPSTLATMHDVLQLGANRVEDATPGVGTRYLQYLNQVPVSTNQIDVVTFNIAAGGATVVDEGAAKPSIEITPAVVPVTLETIAVWTQLSRQLAEDSGAVRAQLNNMLATDVMREMDEEAGLALNGGITADPVDTAGAVGGTTPQDILARIRRGKSYLRNTYGVLASSFFILEEDAEALDLYLAAQTNTAPGTFRPWGLEPIEVAADDFTNLAAGEVVVGDLNRAASHYSRSSVATYVTDSHASTFTSNILTMLTEARSVTAVVRPWAQALIGAPLA